MADPRGPRKQDKSGDVKFHKMADQYPGYSAFERGDLFYHHDTKSIFTLEYSDDDPLGSRPCHRDRDDGQGDTEDLLFTIMDRFGHTRLEWASGPSKMEKLEKGVDARIDSWSRFLVLRSIDNVLTNIGNLRAVRDHWNQSLPGRTAPNPTTQPTAGTQARLVLERLEDLELSEALKRNHQPSGPAPFDISGLLVSTPLTATANYDPRVDSQARGHYVRNKRQDIRQQGPQQLPGPSQPHRQSSQFHTYVPIQDQENVPPSPEQLVQQPDYDQDYDQNQDQQDDQQNDTTDTGAGPGENQQPEHDGHDQLEQEDDFEDSELYQVASRALESARREYEE